MEADDEPAVQAKLRGQQLMPTRIKKKSVAFNFNIGTGVDLKGRRDLHASLRHDDRCRSSDRAVPRHPQQQTDNKRFAVVIRDIKASASRAAPPSATRCAAIRRSSTRSTSTSFKAGEVGGISTRSSSVSPSTRKGDQAASSASRRDGLPERRRHWSSLRRPRHSPRLGHPSFKNIFRTSAPTTRCRG